LKRALSCSRSPGLGRDDRQATDARRLHCRSVVATHRRLRPRQARHAGFRAKDRCDAPRDAAGSRQANDAENRPCTAPAPAANTPTPKAAGGGAPLVATTPAAAAPLDLKALTQQLRETKAIGIFTKITLKNQVDDLLDRFREYYQGKANPAMADLRRSFDLLMMKVLSLLQDEDQALASAIVSSREAIWSVLSDPKKFASLDA
jgi:hypothetical protein